MNQHEINSVELTNLGEQILHLGLINNGKLGLKDTRLTIMLYEAYQVLHTYGQIQNIMNNGSSKKSYKVAKR